MALLLRSMYRWPVRDSAPRRGPLSKELSPDDSTSRASCDSGHTSFSFVARGWALAGPTHPIWPSRLVIPVRKRAGGQWSGAGRGGPEAGGGRRGQQSVEQAAQAAAEHVGPRSASREDDPSGAIAHQPVAVGVVRLERAC